MNRGELESAKRRAMNLFDAWNQVTGKFPPGTGYYGEIEAIIHDAVHCGAQAATGDFRRLENEEGPIAGCPDALPEWMCDHLQTDFVSIIDAAPEGNLRERRKCIDCGETITVVSTCRAASGGDQHG